MVESATRPGVALGVDLGSRRIGISVSDSGRVLARPHSVITRSGDDAKDRDEIAALVESSGATVVVVGVPFSLSGREGPAARAARTEIEALEARLQVPVVTIDERLSTVEATRRLAEARPAGSSRRTVPRRGGATRRRPVDDAAAAIILQSWLDSGATR